MQIIIIKSEVWYRRLFFMKIFVISFKLLNFIWTLCLVINILTIIFVFLLKLIFKKLCFLFCFYTIIIFFILIIIIEFAKRILILFFKKFSWILFFIDIDWWNTSEKNTVLFFDLLFHRLALFLVGTCIVTFFWNILIIRNEGIEGIHF